MPRAPRSNFYFCRRHNCKHRISAMRVTKKCDRCLRRKVLLGPNSICYGCVPRVSMN